MIIRTAFVTTYPVVGAESPVNLFEVVARLKVLPFDLNAAVVVQVIGVAVAADREGHGDRGCEA